MERKLYHFQPGEYYDFEKEMVAHRQGQIDGTVPYHDPRPPMPARPLTEEMILAYNRCWDKYNPLYNDPEYARAHGHPSVPAYPVFMVGAGADVDPFPKTGFDGFYYTNDGSDIYYSRNLYAGDILEVRKEEGVKDDFKDLSVPGGTVRKFRMGGWRNRYDQDGKLVFKCYGSVTEAYKKYAVDETEFDFSENMEEWTTYAAPAHYTTDEDYARIRELWAREVITGDDTPYWEDVEVGQEIAPTCSDGPVTYMHMCYWHQIGDLSIFTREELSDPEFMKNFYRDCHGAYLDETSVHFGNRNIPGARTYWFNDTAAKLVCRTLTNFVGNKGRVSRFSWKMFPFYREIQGERLGADMFDKVPFMRGRYADRHGSEGDTCIGRAVITGKYINEAGEHCCEMACWGETLDGNIVIACPSEVVLPSKEG
jgi:hypothetical protein